MEQQRSSRSRASWQWEVHWADGTDEQELSALFTRSFDQIMPSAQWHWKYAGATPWGVLVRTGGVPVAFYGGMPRQVRIRARKHTAVQIGDVMVDPAYRSILTRRGPFFHAASSFAEQLVGPDKPYYCAFGFPSERHNRLGEHLGLYGRIGSLLEASWTPLPYARSLAVTVRPLEETQGDLVTRLWEQMADRTGDMAILQRDYSYLRHRFLHHPTVTYGLFLVRRRLTGTPIGLLVVRDHGAEGLELLDMVGVPDHLPRLVTIARRIAGKLGRSRLFCRLTAPVVAAVQETKPEVKDLSLPLPTIIWGVSADILDLRDHWWLMGGDADSR